jgi:hypothetical protein
MVCAVSIVEPKSSATNLDADAAGLIEQLLVASHQRSRSQPIIGPDSDGVFPPASALDVLGFAERRPPVVPDTNLLSRDIGFTVRKSTRSVLLNAGNAGAIRLLCPAHVAIEMVSHSAEFSAQVGIAESDYLLAWHRNYLPLMRIVPELADTMFTPTERTRIARLTELDYEDVPAAKLAIAGGGFFLSDDERALTAVYGPSRTLARDSNGFTQWVEALKGWGNANELGNILELGALLARIVSAGVSAAVSRSRAAPQTATAIAIASLCGLIYSYRRASPERRVGLRKGVTITATYLVELAYQHTTATVALKRHAAPQPTTAELATITSNDRLTRACIHHLARHPSSAITAKALSQVLPPRVNPRGEAKVRSVLRTHDCFTQPYRGWFQLGGPHPEMH